MKKTIFIFTVIGIVAGSLLAGCEKKTEQKVEEAKETLKDARAEYLVEWEAFKKESEQQIDANRKRIHSFKEKMEKAGSKVKPIKCLSSTV